MSRTGGLFPFGENAGVVSLNQGGVYYILPGNYLLTLGRVSLLQWWDNATNTWRVVAQPGTTIPVSTDGANYRIVNFSGIVSGCSFTNAGAGATNGIGAAATGVTVSFGAAPTNGRAAAAYPIVGGAINSTIAITQAGSGFLVPPRLIIDAPPNGGIRATAHVATLTSTGGIGSVTVDNQGAGYTAAPGVTILAEHQFYPGAPSGGAAAPAYPAPGLIGGSLGAVLTVNATLANTASLTGLVMTDYGFGYAGTTIPTVTLGGSLTSPPTVTPIMALSMTGSSSLVGGAAYTGGAPLFESSLGFVAATDSNNGVYMIRPARGIGTIAAGAVTGLTIEDPGFGMQKVPLLSIINNGAVATTQATAVATVGGIQDTSVLQPAVGG